MKGSYRRLPVQKSNFQLRLPKKKTVFPVIWSGSDVMKPFRSRQCTVKVNYFPSSGLKRKLDYIAREGCDAEHPEEKTPVYGSDPETFNATKDKRFFSLIISPEKTAEGLTSGEVARHIISRIEAETGRKLLWVAADHHNTNQQHTHIIIRGKDAAGQDFFLSRDLISRGMREAACRYSDAVLGQKTDVEIYTDLYQRICSENVTRLDRHIAGRAKFCPLINGRHYIRPKTAFEEKRLIFLANRGYASRAEVGGRRLYALLPDFIERMAAVQARQDILKQMDFTAGDGDRIVQGITRKTVEASDRIRILSKKPDEEEHGGFRYIARNSRTGEVCWFSADGSFRPNTTVKGSDLLSWRWKNTSGQGRNNNPDKKTRRKK